MVKNFIILFFSLNIWLQASQDALIRGSDKDKKITIIPIESTPQENSVQLKTIFPRPYENKRKNPVNIQLRLKGFSLGMITQNDRAQETYNDTEGQAIHVVIDNEPYLVYNQSINKLFDEDHDKVISFHIPFSLKSGQHIIRCFPVRSYGESLKEGGCFASEVFYFQDKEKLDTININLNKPYITYNEPQGRYPHSKSYPILLDFYISNCQLSADGYKVRLSINGKIHHVLTEWVAYYIYGLEQGKHTVKLELIDKNNDTVPGFFNIIEREIEIE